MINILCFGDSNTYGANPEGGPRFDRNTRWTGILQKLLGEDYYVIEEGLGGRTTVHEDPFSPGRCGRDALPIALSTHNPLDLVILSLGINDCKYIFNLKPAAIAQGAERLCQMIKNFDYGREKAPQILLVCPPPMGDDIEKCPFASYDETSIRHSKELVPYFEAVAKRQGCLFFDGGQVAHSGSDQLHLDEASHSTLAEALCRMIREYSF